MTKNTDKSKQKENCVEINTPLLLVNVISNKVIRGLVSKETAVLPESKNRSQ